MLLKILEAEYGKRLLSVDGISFFCIFGRDGITESKTEGDWKTPIGTFLIRKIYYRKDKIGEILNENIECTPIEKGFAWCDDTNKKEYNKFIRLPFDGSYENLWREDCLYDIIIVIGYNDNPTLPNKGSAIFIHIIKENMQHTKGCLAIKKEDMLYLINKIEKDSKIEIK